MIGLETVPQICFAAIVIFSLDCGKYGWFKVSVKTFLKWVF